MRGVRRVVSFLIVTILAIGVPASSPARAAPLGADIHVNSGFDGNDRDNVLTLREAIMLSEGDLNKGVLTPAEQGQIAGTPGKGLADTILLDIGGIALAKPELPDITDPDTFIKGNTANRTDLFGLGFAYAFRTKTDRFRAENIRFNDFNSDIVSEAKPGAGNTADFRLQNLGFNRAKKGFSLKAGGAGKFNLSLADNDFPNIAAKGILIDAEVGGEYDFLNNRLLDLDAKVAVDLELGGGAGDIKVVFRGNRVSTRKGIGTVVNESHQDGKADYTWDHNEWLGGSAALRAQLRLGGEWDSTNNTVKGHAGTGVQLTARPFGALTTTVMIDADTYMSNRAGLKVDASGKLDMSTHLFSLFDNAIAIEGFLRPGVTAHWTNSRMTVEDNFDGGVRIFGFKALSIELFISGSILNHNKFGGHFKNLGQSVFIDSSTIDSNTQDGLRFVNGDAEVVTSHICANGRDGVRAEGGSDVNASQDIIDLNGAFDVRNLTPNVLSATGNDWGPENPGGAQEMDLKPFPSNISVIFDTFDSPRRGFVNYSNWQDPGAGCRGTPPTTTTTSTSTTTTSSSVPTSSSIPTSSSTPTS